jgi:hypothetical protein
MTAAAACGARVCVVVCVVCMGGVHGRPSWAGVGEAAWDAFGRHMRPSGEGVPQRGSCARVGVRNEQPADVPQHQRRGQDQRDHGQSRAQGPRGEQAQHGLVGVYERLRRRVPGGASAGVRAWRLRGARVAAEIPGLPAAPHRAQQPERVVSEQRCRNDELDAAARGLVHQRVCCRPPPPLQTTNLHLALPGHYDRPLGFGKTGFCLPPRVTMVSAHSGAG